MSLNLGTTASGEAFTMPLEYATRRGAVLAMSGAGKSNTAKLMAEAFYDAGVPWVAIDPKGDWWGIRAGSEGLSLPILGGLHGDVPLSSSAGKLIAELVIEKRLTCVLDVSEFETRQAMWTFLADFGETLLKRNTEVLHLFLEEADEYIPQNTREKGSAPRCLGVWQRVVKRGRFRGLGSTQITQRSAALNKDTLYQAEVLIAMRTAGPGDRKAIEGWVTEQNATREIVDSLPSLNNGEAWVSSPAWLRVTERVQFDRARTFDAGATPVLVSGEKPVTATLADIDFEALREAMAETIEKAEAEDPKKLQARIRDLERQLRERPAIDCGHEAVIEQLQGDLERTAGDLGRIRLHLNEIMAPAKALHEQISTILEENDEPGDTNVLVRSPMERTERTPNPTPQPSTIGQSVDDNRARVSMVQEPGGSVSLVGLRAGARRILAELVSRYPATWTRPQLGALTQFSHKGGTFTTYLGELKRAGLVLEERGVLTASAEAVEILGGTTVAPSTHAEMMGRWRQALRAGNYRMLEVVAQAGSDGITRESLAEAIDMTASGGTFNTYLGILRRNGLVETSGSRVIATDVLWP